MKKILVIDDDRDICLLLNRFLTRKGYQVTEMYTGKKALSYLETTEPDLVMCDFRLEDMDGGILLANIKSRFPDMPVIIITGYNDMRTAVKVMKMGAYDYITKPLLPDEISFTIHQALEKVEKNLDGRNRGEISISEGKQKNGISYSGQDIFGDTESFGRIMKQVNLVGPTNYRVIVYGETGTPKESVAREIHNRSKRRNRPFVSIDCGALAGELAASELLGHEKGSFPGAHTQRIGSLELANEGTLFLDEVADLSQDIQLSLLQVIQEKKIKRLGGTRDIELDVRIIVGSNELLWNATQHKKFMEELYCSFNEFSIDVPPLRESKEDILFFARHFLQQTNRELDKKIKDFSAEVQEIFRNYVWYGNLRELKNVVKRAALLTESDLIEPRSIPFEISNFSKLQFADGEMPVSASLRAGHGESAFHSSRYSVTETSLKEASIDAEYEMILQALKESNYNKSRAAQLLKIDRKTLYNKISLYEEMKSH